MTLGDLLNKMATKIGVQDDQDLIDLLSSSEIATREISDELAQRFDTGLMSLDGAKNNSEVLKHLKPILLKSADDKFAALAEKFGIRDEIAAEKSTYAKFDILERALDAKIAELEKKAGSASGENEKKLQQEIATLHQQLATLTATKDKELADFKAAAAQQQLDALIGFELNGKRYANQELGETNVDIARALITKALEERGVMLVNEGGKLKLKNATSPELDYYDESHKAVSFSDFVNKLLADKHLLEVSNDTDDDHGGGGRPPVPPQNIPPVTLSSDKKVDTSKFDAAVAASAADLEQ